jgi:hypothetical protein
LPLPILRVEERLTPAGLDAFVDHLDSGSEIALRSKKKTLQAPKSYSFKKLDST